MRFTVTVVDQIHMEYRAASLSIVVLIAPYVALTIHAVQGRAGRRCGYRR
jgi:hypothetical protein